MKVAVIGPTLNTRYGIEEIAKHHEIKALFTLPMINGVNKARYVTFEDQASKYGFEIFYEEHNLKDQRVIKRFRDLNLDLIVELGSSKIIPPEVIESAKYGCVGSHGGKLPYIRGGASMNWALINGEKNWGVSIYYLTSDVDKGVPILTKDFKIEDRDDINTVHHKSDLAVAQMLSEFLKDFRSQSKFKKNGALGLIKLNPSPKDYTWETIISWNREVKEKYKDFKNYEEAKGNAIFLPQRKPQDGFIDWNSSSKEVYDFIRAQIPPFPGAFTLYKGKKLFVYKSSFDGEHNYDDEKLEPGQIFCLISNKGIITRTLDRRILIERVQLEGMPEMWADDFFYENDLELGDIFGK